MENWKEEGERERGSERERKGGGRDRDVAHEDFAVSVLVRLNNMETNRSVFSNQIVHLFFFYLILLIPKNY